MNLSDSDVKRVLAAVCEARGHGCPRLEVEEFWPNLASVSPDLVIVGRNLIKLLDNEDELAAVFGHELSHRASDGWDEWAAYHRDGPRVAWTFHMRKEMHADEGAVDLLRKMGRDPTAVVSMIEKINDPARHSDTSDGKRAYNLRRYIADTN
jgi:Zn-dependent protease with chaperone function